jgi:ketosteroid isomerase-like protein
MSQANVDKIQEYIDAYNRRDFETAVAWFDPEIEFVLPERQSADNCHGTDEILEFWRGLDETFDDFQLEVRQHVDAGERIATELRFFGRGKGSGLELDAEMYHQVATFHEGRVARLDYFGTWPEALEAVEVSA